METDQRFLVRMKIIVNMIAGIAFIVQFAFSAFSMLTMQKPITINEIFYNNMLLVALPCSSIIVLLFLLLYNFNYKFLNNKIINVFFSVIGILALYIHAYQLFVLHDLILISVVLLLIDCYVIIRVIRLFIK
jgi:hypothetical protein